MMLANQGCKVVSSHGQIVLLCAQLAQGHANVHAGAEVSQTAAATLMEIEKASRQPKGQDACHAQLTTWDAKKKPEAAVRRGVQQVRLEAVDRVHTEYAAPSHRYTVKRRKNR